MQDTRNNNPVELDISSTFLGGKISGTVEIAGPTRRIPESLKSDFYAKLAEPLRQAGKLLEDRRKQIVDAHQTEQQRNPDEDLDDLETYEYDDRTMYVRGPFSIKVELTCKIEGVTNADTVEKYLGHLGNEVLAYWVPITIDRSHG